MGNNVDNHVEKMWKNKKGHGKMNWGRSYFKITPSPIRRRGVLPMEELYRAIEAKIKASGYPHPVDGREFYNDLCDEMEERENGTYLLMIKQEGDTYFECRVDIMDDNFDIPFMDIHDGDKVYHVDFDAE